MDVGGKQAGAGLASPARKKDELGLPSAPTNERIVGATGVNPDHLVQGYIMQTFAARSNIERFKRLIATTTDADQLVILKNLLQIEETRLCTLPAKR